MKTIKYLLTAISMTAFFACSDSEEGISCTEIVSLSSTSREGQIELNWDYPEGDNTIRYIEINYLDPAKQKEVKHTVSVYTKNFIIANALQKYGEYVFKLQPFSTDLAPGSMYEVRATSLKAPAVYEFTSTEFALTAEDVHVEGIKDSAPGDMLDGNLETFINTDYTKPVGTVFWIDVTLPKTQDFLKFSYINRNHEAASFPAEIECYVKANEADEWTLIKTLTANEDNLPEGVAAKYISKEISAPFPFNYFRFRVPKTHTGKPNFSLAEFAVFNVKYNLFDPES